MQDAFDDGSEQTEPFQPESCQGTLTDRCVPPLAFMLVPIVKRYPTKPALACVYSNLHADFLEIAATGNRFRADTFPSSMESQPTSALDLVS